MSHKDFTHISESGQPRMADVSMKNETLRKARAHAIVTPGKELLALLKEGEIHTRKGPVFSTAIVAGVMAAKKTSELIPFCHPLFLEDCQLKIEVREDHIVIESEVVLTGKTGVEMEALTAVSVAALTVYDMCKSVSTDIVIREIKLLEKTGGKKDIKRT